MKLKYVDTAKTPHAYYLDGKRCKGVTGIAGIPDDTYGLDMWKQRMIVIGMATEPALVKRAAANVEDRDTMREIGELALRAARAHEKAERGTALHEVLERHDLGALAVASEWVTSAEARAARAGWDKALAEAKITLDDDYIERCLVHPTERIAGRMDRFVRVGRSRSMTVLDLKTGKIDYPHKIAIQLALYANASQMAGPLDEDGITTDFTELPDMDRKWGLIAHMPTPGEIDIHKIDIAAGWKAAQEICFKTIKWRENKSLLKPFVSVDVVDPTAPATEEEIAMVKARIAAIKAAGEPAVRLLMARWPSKIAKPRESGTWTAADVERIDTMLATVERDGEVPF